MATDPRARLISRLTERRLLLFVGAGSSVPVGYPGWNQLMRGLAGEIEIEEAAGLDTLAEASRIKAAFRDAHREDDFDAALQDAFSPREPPYRQLHSDLAALGFRGVVTTNYDPVFENAFMGLHVSEGATPQCEAIDLCDPRGYDVFDFIRGVADGPYSAHVLHLHGWYRNPQQLILTQEDYDSYYGSTAVLDEHGAPASRELDSTHRKVI